MPVSFANAVRWLARALPALVAVPMLLAVTLGFFGDFYPALDTIGQGRLHLCVGLLLFAPALLLRRGSSLALVCAVVGGLGLYSTLPFLPLGHGTEASVGTPRYTLLQMNLDIYSTDQDRALSLIARLRPDIVTAEELSASWVRGFEKLAGSYPYRFYCKAPFLRGNGDVAILSRRPFIEVSAVRPGELTVCDGPNAFGAKTVDFNGIPVTIGAQHLRWPWPGRQPSMVQGLKTVLPRLRDPLIVAGDFNSAPWSASVRALAQASGTRIVGGIGPTWIKRGLPPELGRWIGLPIDNMLVSESVDVLKVERPEAVDSDHLPVLLTFTLRFATSKEPDVRSAER
ncbi:endonuclease/exonuclease/phosphatase family protein [Aureimonas psammosilenae]|uniref:endonuclease/exonuclease/phosphatase family protein n=1 Tax=Aureimonas psammosilenae TaxID=2495496 RepID=UPI001260CE30|nr:endonuclease/exonuclease/phosphatase family protein [Aureimonas psammosilenae]